jgi:cytoplasmic iron level regulating protein YaaA (DUF328/UPF0246 family)
MIAVISPAKLLDTTTKYPHVPYTIPAMLDDAEKLMSKLKKLPVQKVGEMMDLSKELAELNKQRYMEWSTPFTPKNAKQAILTFNGEVYRGLQAGAMSVEDLNFAQKHLRILSGLYGIMRPLDLMQAYRLMMGTPFAYSTKAKNLYQFWGDKLALSLASEMKEKDVLINLASGEYFKAIPLKVLNIRVITCEFKELKDDKFVTVMTFAKLARGMMARYMIEQRITKPENLKLFNSEGYEYNDRLSESDQWVFTRRIPPKKK